MNVDTTNQLYAYLPLACACIGTVYMLAKHYILGVAVKAREFVEMWVTALVLCAAAVWLIIKYPQYLNNGMFLVLLVIVPYLVWRRVKKRKGGQVACKGGNDL